MNSLTQYTGLLKRFPEFELSYETTHKKVSASSDVVKYDSIALAIPIGRKYFIWHTYQENGSENACYLLGLDKDKRICSVERKLGCAFPSSHSLGTVVYGTLYETTSLHICGGGMASFPVMNENEGRRADGPPLESVSSDYTSGYSCNVANPPNSSIFVAEDIYMFRGIRLHNLCFGNRIGFLREFIEDCPEYALPVMWYINAGGAFDCVIPADLARRMGYVAHHVQYREISRVSPYVNVPIQKRGVSTSLIMGGTATAISSAEVAQKMTAAIQKPIPRFDYGKPAYRYPAVFNIMADPQLDLYHLYAFSESTKTSGGVYCGLACVQSYKTSVFMNRLFRRIRENENLDLAEESEDEADFENMDANKFVYLDRVIQVECLFNQKHRKWVPVRVARKDERVIHIDKLVLNSGGGAFRSGNVGNGNNRDKSTTTTTNRQKIQRR